MTTPPYGRDPYQAGGPTGSPAGEPWAMPAGQAPTSASPYETSVELSMPYSPAAYASPVSGPVAFGPPPQQPVYYPPAVGFASGYAPLTGLPFSEKSKTTAGLLQLLLAVFFALGGVGRLYAGNTALGATQLGLTFVGWLSFFCGFFLIVPWFAFIGLWVWFVVDGIVMLAGQPVDEHGRPLR